MTGAKDWIAADAPSVSESALLRRVAEGWGLSGELHPLYAERDRNFRLDAPDGFRYLVKVMHPDVPRDALALQDRTLRHLEEASPQLFLPRALPDRDGRTLVPLPDGAVLRLLSWLDGRPRDLATASAAARHAAGAALAALDRALAPIDATGARRDLAWDLLRFQTLAPLLPTLGDPALTARARAALDLHRETLAPALATLPRQLIHNDLNPDNLLFRKDAPDVVAGIIDFGDMVAAPPICDLAVACAYTMDEGSADPLAGVLDTVHGYQTGRPLATKELRLLPGLIQCRLATTALIQGARFAQAPDAELEETVREADLRLQALQALGEVSVHRLFAACEPGPAA